MILCVTTRSAGHGLFSYAPPSFPAVNYGSFLGNGLLYEMIFTGDNFGVANTPATVWLTFGNGTTQQACSAAVSISHTQLKCQLALPATSNLANPTSDWEGIFYNAFATVDGLTSTDGSNKFAYEGLVIDRYDPGTNQDLTIWGQQVLLYGRNLGPSNTGFTIDFTAGGNTVSMDSTNYPSTTFCTGGPGAATTVCAPKTYYDPTLTPGERADGVACTVIPSAEKVSGIDCSASSSCSAPTSGSMVVKVTDANGNVKSSNSVPFTYKVPEFNDASVAEGFPLGEYGGSEVSYNVKYADTTCTSKTATWFSTVGLTSYSIDDTSVTGYAATILPGNVVVDKTHASASNPQSADTTNPLKVDMTLNGFTVLNPESRLAFRVPTVTAISPSYYTFGGTITVTGTGFGPLGGANWLTTTTHRADVGIKVHIY